ncbi:hypothetical protein FRC10_010775 [Ceratobasidium sp. 414]|nr:hypothetical protein FRC10_010775 [Ceratobasidium sp. 414]
MIWKNLAAQFAPLIPVFRGPFLPAETRTGGDNFEPNFCGNIDLKNLGDEFLSYYEYGTTRCLCMGKIPTLLAHPDSHLSSAILRFGIEETRERLESLVDVWRSTANAPASQVLESAESSAVPWNAPIWNKPRSNDSSGNQNSATRDVRPAKKFVASLEPKTDGSA